MFKNIFMWSEKYSFMSKENKKLSIKLKGNGKGKGKRPKEKPNIEH